VVLSSRHVIVPDVGGQRSVQDKGETACQNFWTFVRYEDLRKAVEKEMLKICGSGDRGAATHSSTKAHSETTSLEPRIGCLAAQHGAKARTDSRV